jgi:quercetin dioxygenase-like cupin family protein
MEIEHTFAGGIYVKKSTFERGEWGEQHKHAFAHISIVASGFFRLTAEGAEPRELGPGAVVEMPADVAHRVQARTGGVWMCVWPSHVGDDDPVKQDRAVIASTTPTNDPS